MKPLIFITNDDGYTAGGIRTLADALKPVGDLFVVAPDRARSGAGCSVTSTVPVSCRHVSSGDGVSVYACSGTPADCTKLALGQLLVRQPDLIVSGINHGGNASVNVHYSGTVGAATEGALHGIPSIAFSSVDPNPEADLSHIAPLCRHIVDLVMQHDLPFGTFLNVNFPLSAEIKGIRPCRLAYSRWTEEFEPCSCPRGGKHFWLAGENVNEEPDDDSTDLWALEHGYAAVTPVMTDPTDRRLIASMDEWDL